MTLDDNLVAFMAEVDCYLKEQHDAHIEDLTITEDHCVRIYVIDSHKNDIVWTMKFHGDLAVVLTAVVDGKLLSCVVSLQSWAVGAILMS